MSEQRDPRLPAYRELRAAIIDYVETADAYVKGAFDRPIKLKSHGADAATLAPNLHANAVTRLRELTKLFKKIETDDMAPKRGLEGRR